MAGGPDARPRPMAVAAVLLGLCLLTKLTLVYLVPLFLVALRGGRGRARRPDWRSPPCRR